MGSQFKVYLFGDQTFDLFPNLRQLLYSKNSPLLESFFEQAYYKIRAEIGSLPATERESYAHFTSIADILSWERQHTLHHPPIQSALTCIYQLGEFIR